MRIWTVISCGDGEAYSAWLTQELAWDGALVLAEKIRKRFAKQSMANLFEKVRVRVENEHYEVAVETLARRSKCLHANRTPREWQNRSTVRVAAVEIQGDVVSALAKVSE